MKKRVYSRSQSKKDSPFYFDDCLICQTTKKADERGKSLSAEELKEAFRKANESN